MDLCAHFLQRRLTEFFVRCKLTVVDVLTILNENQLTFSSIEYRLSWKRRHWRPKDRALRMSDTMRRPTTLIVIAVSRSFFCLWHIDWMIKRSKRIKNGPKKESKNGPIKWNKISALIGAEWIFFWQNRFYWCKYRWITLSVSDLRKVYPYYFTFTTFTKGRWVGERILDVFAREFRAHPAEEYVMIYLFSSEKLSTL